MRDGGLIAMKGPEQGIDAVGKEDHVGQARDVRLKVLLFHPFPAAMVIADEWRQIGKRREIAQQFLAADAMRLGAQPFEIAQRARMGATRRNATVMEQTGIVKQHLDLLAKAKLAGEVAGQHANPATVQQVVDPDQIDGVGNRHDQLAQVDGKILRQSRCIHDDQPEW